MVFNVYYYVAYSVCNTRCSLFRTNWKQRYEEVGEERRASVVRKILSVLLVVSIVLAIPAYAMAEGTIGYVKASTMKVYASPSASSKVLAVMYKGQIVEQGPVDDVYEHPQHEYTKKLLSCVPTIRK